MSENTNGPTPALVKSPRTWDFIETTFVSLLADGAFVLTGGIVVAIVLVTLYGQMPPLKVALEGRWQGVGLVAGGPAAIVVIWIAIRMAGREFSEYLALNWPAPGEIVRAFAVTAGLLIAESYFLAAVGGANDCFVDFHRQVHGSAGLLILLIGGCIMAPVMEEFVVRGFMFRGWSESFLGPIGAIILTSAVWALNHTQYGWPGRFSIFVTGLSFGYFRWRSNSTWLTVMLHSALNIAAFFLSGPYT